MFGRMKDLSLFAALQMTAGIGLHGLYAIDFFKCFHNIATSLYDRLHNPVGQQIEEFHAPRFNASYRHLDGDYSSGYCQRTLCYVRSEVTSERVEMDNIMNEHFTHIALIFGQYSNYHNVVSGKRNETFLKLMYSYCSIYSIEQQFLINNIIKAANKTELKLPIEKLINTSELYQPSDYSEPHLCLLQKLINNFDLIAYKYYLISTELEPIACLKKTPLSFMQFKNFRNTLSDSHGFYYNSEQKFNNITKSLYNPYRYHMALLQSSYLNIHICHGVMNGLSRILNTPINLKEMQEVYDKIKTETLNYNFFFSSQPASVSRVSI